MKKMQMVMMVVIGLFVLQARAAFVQPTDEQLAQAAGDPAQVSALLADASPEQAAQVVRDVALKILGLSIEPAAQNARVGQLVSAAMNTMSAQAAPFAAALGTTVGNAAVIVANAGAVSAVQNAIATSGGANGAALAASFGNAFTAASGSSSSGTPPPPPADNYNGPKKANS